MSGEIKEKLESVLAKLKQDKKVMFIILAGFIGMLLIFFSGDEAEIKETANETAFSTEQEVEKKLENLIGKIDGAGKVSVMITYESSQEDIYATDTDEDEKQDAISKKQEHIIVDDGDGETGLKIKTIYPKIKGVAVVCDGASNAVIKEQIVSVVSALFDISTNNISVVNMEK